jgi:hypothetical protein
VSNGFQFNAITSRLYLRDHQMARVEEKEEEEDDEGRKKTSLAS